MAEPRKLLDAEPVVTVATITGIGAALVACLVAFGLPLNNNQQGAVLGLLAVVAPLVVIVARRWTWAPRSMRQVVADVREECAVSGRAVPSLDQPRQAKPRHVT